MKYFGIGFLLFVILEITSIVFFTDAIGGFAVFLWLIASVFIGMFMLRTVGFSGIFLLGEVWRSGGNVSWYQALWPVRYVLAALLFICPGMFSDFLALILMLPFKGAAIGPNNFTFGDQGPMRDSSDDVIEGEFEEVETDDPRLPKN